MNHPHQASRFCRMTLCGALFVLAVAAGVGCVDPGSGGVAGTGGATGTGGGMASGGAGVLGSGGTTASGGAIGTGGSAGTGGMTGTGGTTATGTGGTIGTGGAVGTGGALGTGGRMGTGGSAGRGGTAGTAGRMGSAGATGTGGSTGIAGRMGSAGATGTGGSTGSAGRVGTAGATGIGGSTGAGGATGAAPSTGCGKAAGLTSARASIDVAGKTREYILAIPSNYDQNYPHKLIFAWHPWGGSAQQVASGRYHGLSNVINGQAILVAPEGQDYQDGGLGWGNVNGEDVAFFQAMVERFGSQLCIDHNRIFSTGFSFGAMFSFTLGCTQNSMIRAIAPQAGNAMTSGRCENGTRSVPTMAFIGVDDSLLSGHRQAVQIFVQRNGCTTQTTTLQPSWCDGLAASNQPCTCVEYQGCKAGYPVISCEYKAGHIPAPMAGATLWNFFSQF